MKNFKRIAALGLSTVMAFSMIGCGSDKKDKSESTEKTEAKSVSTIYDAFDLIGNFNKGSYDVNVDATFNMDGANGTVSTKSSGKINGKNMALGASEVKVDFADESFEAKTDDSIIIADGRAYIDLDGIVKSVADVDSEFGSYGLLLPSESEFKFDTSNCKELANSLIKALLEGAEVTGENGEFTAEVKDAEGYKKSAKALLDWVDANQDKVFDLVKDAVKSADVKGYVNRLIDDIDDDLVAAAEVLGMGQLVNSNTIDQIKETVNTSLDSFNADELLKDFNIKDSVEEIKAEFDKITDEEWNKAFENFEKSGVKISVKVGDDSYKVAVSADVKDKSGEGFTLTFDYSFKSEDVTIEKPANAHSLKEIAEYAKDHMDLLNKIVSKAEEAGEGLLNVGDLAF